MHAKVRLFMKCSKVASEKPPPFQDDSNGSQEVRLFKDQFPGCGLPVVGGRRYQSDALFQITVRKNSPSPAFICRILYQSLKIFLPLVPQNTNRYGFKCPERYRNHICPFHGR